MTCALLISKALKLARVNEGSHSFTCHPHVDPVVKVRGNAGERRLSTYGKSHPAFTPQPRSITALWPVLISHPAEGMS